MYLFYFSGPRFICDLVTDIKAAVDTRYYTGRPNDDNLPVELGEANRWSSFGHDNHEHAKQRIHCLSYS